MREMKRIEHYLALAGLVLLLIGSGVILKPFLSALLIAIILTLAAWPLYERIHRLLPRHPSVAAGVMVAGLAALFLLPLALLLASFGAEAANASDALRKLFAGEKIVPADVLRKLPVVGEYLASRWQEWFPSTTELAKKLQPYASSFSGAFLGLAATLGTAMIELCLALFISFFLFRNGLVLAEELRAGLTKLAGTRAEGLLRTAGMTLKSVIYGIIGTGVVQGVLATIGLLIAGVPTAVLLGFLTSVLSLVPVGPPLIWIPASIWLFTQGKVVWAVFMALWGVVVISGSDNIVKPYLISKGSDLPLVLIFAGVIGGVMQFGFLGVFLGPTILALFYSLLKEWVAYRPERLAQVTTE